MAAGNGFWRRWRLTQREHPRKIVAVDASDGLAVTASGLGQMAEAMGAGALGETGGRAVAFQLPNGIPWLALFLALQRAGAAAVPIDPKMDPASAEDLAARVGASFFWRDGIVSPLAPARAVPDGTCCVKSTSGSTGSPQAVDCLPRHLLADGRNIVATMGIRAADRNLGLIPFGHSYGLGNLVMPLILQGTTIVCAPDFVPGQIPGWIREHRVTVFPSVPVVFRWLAEAGEGRSLSPLRLAISAGSALAPGIARDFLARFKIGIHNFYGSSETGGIAYDPCGRSAAERGSVGLPMRGVRVTITGGGRIEVRSRAVAVGGGRHRVPDTGCWNSAGELCITGRESAVANIGGKKVHPAEVEKALRSLPGVSDVWVGVFGSDHRDYLGALVETGLSPETIRRQLAASLPAWKIPRLLSVSASLPRTARGKVDAAAARALAAAG